MTEQTGSKVPQIRLKGFDRAWEDKPIGEVLAEKKRPVVLKDHQRYELITVKRRNEGVVLRGHLFGRDILVKNYSQLQAGDFVISKRQVVHGATGIIPPKLDGAIVSNEYLVAVDSNSLLTGFLTILASLPDMRQKFFLSSYGVDIEKLFFDAEDWKKRNVIIPGITEQTQICEYFKGLDCLIGLHQRKHDKLVTLKKAMHQKMFPQAGASTPEIRFKGFTRVWVEQKLGELCDEFHSGKFISASEITETGEYPVHGGNGLRGFTARFNHDGLYAVIGRQGALCGNMNLFSGKAFFTEHAIAVQANKDNDTVFLYYLFGQMNLGQYSSQSAQPGLAVNKLQELRSYICTKSEQIQIGSYFRTLDALISKHAIQLQKLKQIKSACLEKMFV
ncbi:MAG: restriction modification system, specificity subunit [Polaromonas sp.]|jgi:type I restriction enzyme S subunit|nr:restriction modification system, specificity subunit [Polaromonas sp.]